jgi:hypothetical protein
MGRRIQGYGDTFDPDTMKLLARAFDSAWAHVRRDETSVQAEDRRTPLALIIPALAREGSRNELEIRQWPDHRLHSPCAIAPACRRADAEEGHGEKAGPGPASRDRVERRWCLADLPAPTWLLPAAGPPSEHRHRDLGSDPAPVESDSPR